MTALAAPIGESIATVKIQLFGGIAIGRVGTPQLTKDGVAEVASLDDLMATMLKVIMQRITAKDYQDVATLIRNGCDLALGLASARQMYGLAFQPSECLKALLYFQSSDLAELSQADRETLIKAVKKVRELAVLRLRSKQLSGLGVARDQNLDL